MSTKQIVNIQHCCEYLKEAIEDPNTNSVHISEMDCDKEIAPFYMNVETNDGVKPCFLKYCPDCGTQLSKHKW